MSAAANNAFRIKGKDGPIDVPNGEFYFNTNARITRMMKNDLSSDARRVYASLERATMGFRQELAVVMTKDGLRPMTPADILSDTGLDKGSARRGLIELEREGLAERKSSDGPDGPLHKGKVELYSWAVPKPPQNAKRGARAPTIPDWIPKESTAYDSIRSFLKRHRIQLPQELEGGARAYHLERLERVARAYEEAEKGVRNWAEEVCAQPENAGVYKEDRQDRYTETDKGEGKPTPGPESDTPPPLPAPVPVVAEAEPVTAVAVTDPDEPEKHVLYDNWRNTMEHKACKPVTVELNRQCWPLFKQKSLATCRRIVEDADIRADQVWMQEKNMAFIPGPLKYLQSNIWATEPLKRRPTAAQQKEAERRRREQDFMARHAGESS